MCVGDFNEILLSHEKLGGAPRSETAMREFRELVGTEIYLERQAG